MHRERIRFEYSGFPVVLHHLQMREGDIYRGMHSHKAIEIVWVKSGTLCCWINDELIELSAPHIIFINSNKGHRLYSVNAEIMYLYIDIDLLEENTINDGFSKLYSFISQAQAKPYMLFHDNNEVTQLLQKMDAKYQNASKENHWYMKAYTYELIAFMYSQAFITPLKISKDQLNKIEPLVCYINENFKSPITLDDICSAARYNKYTLCHTFRKITNGTIFDYINYLRAYYAVEKLRETGSSISEIATECGFTSATYFNRVFKTYFGCAPSIYRKLLNKSMID